MDGGGEPRVRGFASPKVPCFCRNVQADRKLQATLKRHSCVADRTRVAPRAAAPQSHTASIATTHVQPSRAEPSRS
jgi:hypothetical protein